jgi:hypothetical protein
MRYRDNEPVLKSISFSVAGGTKVDVYNIHTHTSTQNTYRTPHT